MALKELREQRAEIVKSIRKMADLANDKTHEWTAEDETNWTAANKDFDAVEARIQREERANQVQSLSEVADMPVPRTKPQVTEPSAAVTEEDRCLALQAWLRCQSGMQLEDRHEDACRKTGTNPQAIEFDIPLRRDYEQVRREFRMTKTATEGGEYVPVGFLPQLEIALLAFNPMRQVSTILRTDSGNALHIPMTNDTGNSAVLLAEAGEVLVLDVVTSELVLDAYKYTSKSVKVSSELLQDSAIDVASMLARLLGERLGRGTNTAYTTADGSSKPKGLMACTTLGVTTASATAITSDEIIDLVHTVDIAYRNGAAFMMRDSTYAYLRKLKNAVDGSYMWEPNTQVAGPDRLLGFPVYINNDIAAIASTAKTVAFGLLSKYTIRDVASIRLRRLVERYADFDQEAFVAFMRTDGDLLDAGTHPIKHLLQKT